MVPTALTLLSPPSPHHDRRHPSLTSFSMAGNYHGSHEQRRTDRRPCTLTTSTTSTTLCFPSTPAPPIVWVAPSVPCQLQSGQGRFCRLAQRYIPISYVILSLSLSSSHVALHALCSHLVVLTSGPLLGCGTAYGPHRVNARFTAPRRSLRRPNQQPPSPSLLIN